MKRRSLIKSIAIGAVAPALLADAAASTPAVAGAPGEDINNQRVWFRQPGKFWNSQSLHLGNGFLGLSFLGGAAEEIFSITEKSLWTGGPGEYSGYRYGIKPGGKDHLEEIRRLILSGEVEKLKCADALSRAHFLGDAQGYGHFSAFGRMSLRFGDKHAQYCDYVRCLDLSRSLAHVDYASQGVRYRRDYFCSYPDRVAVLSFSSSASQALSFTLIWSMFHEDHQISLENDVLCIAGTTNGNGRSFCLRIQFRYTDGRVFLRQGDVVVESVGQISLVIAAATEYVPVAPRYGGADPRLITANQLAAVRDKSVDALRQAHVSDYRRLYDRVRLQLATGQAGDAEPSDLRWRAHARGGCDPGLKVLYFNLGRYLLISASRPGSLPANLQGGWNMFEAAQWSGNYQSNINVQLNYSGAGSADLLECQEPYLEWIKGLVQPGTAVAQAYYASEGWVSHAVGNIWGYAAPGFELEWGLYPVAAAWHCHYVWKHFAFSQDRAYLAGRAYPILKGASQFWLQNLLPYEGYLVTGPSGSAEHGVVVENGKLREIGSSFGQDIVNVPCNFQDIEMVAELFENTIASARILKVDAPFVEALEYARLRLMPLKIGRHGQLQEWYEDIDTVGSNHRHIAHLYALWPAKQISADDQALAAAASKTLLMRGQARNYRSDGHRDVYTAGNWSLALRMACWLRLRQADRADRVFADLITQAGFENLMTYQHVPAPKDVADDLQVFEAGGQTWLPVWQVDASMALAGLVLEMLVQSKLDGDLVLLPALPHDWPEGRVTGIKAEGGLTVDLRWARHKVVHYTIYATDAKRVGVWIEGRRREAHVVVRRRRSPKFE